MNKYENKLANLLDKTSLNGYAIVTLINGISLIENYKKSRLIEDDDSVSKLIERDDNDEK